MAVKVSKAVSIHEPKALRLVQRASSSDGLGDEIVNLLPALAAEADQYLCSLGRIADGPGGKLADLGMRHQHDEGRLVDDEARCRVTSRPRIVRVAECLEKNHRLPQVGDWDVDDDLFVHVPLISIRLLRRVTVPLFDASMSFSFIDLASRLFIAVRYAKGLRKDPPHRQDEAPKAAMLEVSVQAHQSAL